MPTIEESIKELIRNMNAAWLAGRIEDLYPYFSENVVLAPPAGGERIVGRDAMVESFRQYTEQATTHHFEEMALLVDIVDETAVATLQFNVRYQFEGQEYDEIGKEILVLRRSGPGWQIVWRTQIPDDA